jgi:hypothetical protein
MDGLLSTLLFSFQFIWNRKCILNVEGLKYTGTSTLHRVPEILSFRRNWVPPPPTPGLVCLPPPIWFLGGVIRACGGVDGGPNSDTGADIVVLFSKKYPDLDLELTSILYCK